MNSKILSKFIQLKDDIDWFKIAGDSFKSFGEFYPTYSIFLNYIRENYDDIPVIIDFKKEHDIKKSIGDLLLLLFRQEFTDFYYNQEIVQIFQPAPKLNAIKHDPSFYPKLIAFYPFERFYCDTGKIVIYPTTKYEAKLKKKVLQPELPIVDAVEDVPKAPKVAVEDVAVEGEVEFDSRIKLYKNKKPVADTAFIEFKDSNGVKFRFEKRLGPDINKNKQWINDNVLQPYLLLTTDAERDAFLKNLKAKKK